MKPIIPTGLRQSLQRTLQSGKTQVNNGLDRLNQSLNNSLGRYADAHTTPTDNYVSHQIEKKGRPFSSTEKTINLSPLAVKENKETNQLHSNLLRNEITKAYEAFAKEKGFQAKDLWSANKKNPE